VRGLNIFSWIVIFGLSTGVVVGLRGDGGLVVLFGVFFFLYCIVFANVFFAVW